MFFHKKILKNQMSIQVNDVLELNICKGSELFKYYLLRYVEEYAYRSTLVMDTTYVCQNRYKITNLPCVRLDHIKFNCLFRVPMLFNNWQMTNLIMVILKTLITKLNIWQTRIQIQKREASIYRIFV